jgi:DNA repair protein RecN (Recombination protein N)
MLRYLSIQHLAVIEGVAIEFQPGLNVLTGETGAGKSILVEAVGLLLGARASADLVRTGEEVATIQAIFEDRDQEVIVRREITAQGRSRAFINGALATAGALRDLASRLIELHGQHEHQGLLVPENHLDVLDAYARLDAGRAEVASLWEILQRLRIERDRLQLDERQKAQRLDLLTFQRDEIERVHPAAGEDATLGAQRQVLASAERLQRLSGEAYVALYESDGAVLSGLTSVWRRVADLAAIDPEAAPYLEARDSIKSQLEDLAFFLRGYADRIDASPERLQAVEDRLSLLERLKKKYGPTLDDVRAHGEQVQEEIDVLGSAEERAAGVARELAGAEESYRAAAGRLSTARRAAASRFARDLIGVLGSLALERTRFEVRFNEEPLPPGEWGPRGFDRAEFYVSPNPGEDLRPLARVASGGELSRLMLGVKTLAARQASGATLIFDEVDAGIGGRTADVVGRKLRELGREFQVLCITHLPQIAAHGAAHFHIAKTVRRDRTITEVCRLDGAAREEEVARMIAGAEVTAGVLASAREMLASKQAKDEGKAKGESEGRRAKGRA